MAHRGTRMERAVRVLHIVATGQRRGGEVSASDLVRALDRLGAVQRVAVVHGIAEPEVDFGQPVALLGAGSRRMPLLRTDPGALARLRALIRSFEPDIIQTHGGDGLKYAVLSGLDGGRVVYRRIGSVGYWLKPGPRRLVHTALIRRAARVVAVAESVRQELIASLKLPPERVLTIPNGVDARRLVPARPRDEVRASLGIDPGAAVVVSVGALSEEKDPCGHLEVIAAALGGLPSAVGLFVGDGPMRADLEAAVGRLRGDSPDGGPGNRVLVLGSRDDVGDLLAASDVLLLASRTEGMPACVIEAGMAGLPVAAYAVAGVPEVVRHGESGLLVEPGDPEGLAVALAGLLADAGERRAMGRRAMALCHATFGINQIAQRYLDLYASVASAPAGLVPATQLEEQSS